MENLIIGPKNRIIGLNKKLSDDDVLLTLIQQVDMRDAILKEAKRQGYTILKAVDAFDTKKPKKQKKHKTRANRSVKGINYSGINGPMEKRPVAVYNTAGVLINRFESQAQASIHTGVNAKCVSTGCLRKQKTSTDRNGQRIVFRFRGESFE